MPQTTIITILILSYSSSPLPRASCCQEISILPKLMKIIIFHPPSCRPENPLQMINAPSPLHTISTTGTHSSIKTCFSACSAFLHTILTPTPPAVTDACYHGEYQQAVEKSRAKPTCALCVIERNQTMLSRPLCCYGA